MLGLGSSRIPAAFVLLVIGVAVLRVLPGAVALGNSSSSSRKSPEPPSPAPIRATVMPLTPMILPLCPKSGVLNSINPLEFPGRAWHSMSIEQQALHPINLVFLNLASMPTTERQSQMNPCLNTWGIKTNSIKRIKKNYRVTALGPQMATEVLIMRTTRDVFVVFRATDDDWVADFDCVYSNSVNRQFNAPRGFKDIRLHKGFWTAYKIVESQLMQEIGKAVLAVKAGNPFGTPSVWFVGHSLGGALGSIAALKLAQEPPFMGRIGGVISFGSPRVGNEAWQQLYNEKLLGVTLRWANFRDIISAVPLQNQPCLSARQSRFSYRHVGRAVQMCPTPDGLQQFVFHPNGTEGVCTPGEFPTIATHLLGNYFDGWRRAFAQKFGIPAGLMLATSVHVRSVMCSSCAHAVKPYPLPTNKAARNDGVVTCVNDKSCNNRLNFGLVSWSGLAMTSFYREDATCDPVSMTCQVPIPGSQTVINAVSRVAANLTLADLAELAAAVVPNQLLDTTSQLLNTTSQLAGLLLPDNSSRSNIPASVVSSQVATASLLNTAVAKSANSSIIVKPGSKASMPGSSGAISKLGNSTANKSVKTQPKA